MNTLVSRHPSRSILLCLAMLLLAGNVFAADSAVEHPSWFKESFLEIADDVDEARANGKHVVLFFDLNDCPYCTRMIKESFTESDYIDFIKQNFDVIVLNIKGDREVALDEHTQMAEKDLAEHLNVKHTPAMIFLGADNSPVLRIDGYRSAADFKVALDYVYERAYARFDLAKYREQLNR